MLGLTRAQGWATLFLVYTALFVLIFGYRYLDDLSRERAGTFGVRFLEECTGVYSAFILLPLVFRAARSYVLVHKGWLRLIGLHLAGAVAYSFLHTTLMAVSRWLISPLVGLGSYDYGVMLFRYPMEFSNDLLGYTVIVAGVLLFGTAADRAGAATGSRRIAGQTSTGATRESEVATATAFFVQHAEYDLFGDV